MSVTQTFKRHAADVTDIDKDGRPEGKNLGNVVESRFDRKVSQRIVLNRLEIMRCPCPLLKAPL